jgi:hypothetical protein
MQGIFDFRISTDVTITLDEKANGGPWFIPNPNEKGCLSKYRGVCPDLDDYIAKMNKKMIASESESQEDEIDEAESQKQWDEATREQQIFPQDAIEATREQQIFSQDATELVSKRRKFDT